MWEWLARAAWRLATAWIRWVEPRLADPPPGHPERMGAAPWDAAFDRIVAEDLREVESWHIG